VQPASNLASAAPVADTPNLNSLQGLRVSEIHINTPAVQDTKWLEQLIPQKAGEPLDKYKVRRSVQVLYDTGRFAELEVQAEQTPRHDVVLTFAARENYFFGSLRAQGAGGSRPTDSQLINAARLTLGELFSEEKVQAGIQGMQRMLQENGYFQATIVPFYEWDSPNQQVKVLFQVYKRTSARVGTVEVSGDPGMTVEDVREVAGLHSGDRITSGKLTRALDRLRKHYQREGRLQAQVGYSRRTYNAESNTLDCYLEITRGPVVDVRVEGVKMRRGVIKKVVPVFEENAVDDDLLNEGSRAIKNYLQSKGYFDAQVSYELRKQPDTDRQDIVYRVDRRGRHKFVELQIEGNHYFTRDEIRERMQMQPAGGLLLYGLFSQAILANDIQAIQNLYLTNGFRQTKVTSQLQDNYGGKGRLRVSLSINEGPQSTVGKLSIEGNQQLTTDEVRALVSSTEGQPYSDALVINDQTQVLNAYFNLGFPQAKFDYSTQPDESDSNKINVSYRITEGAQVFIDKILTAGLYFTRPSVIDRRMKIESGQPLSQQKMLESQSRLYNLGIFNEVTMAVQNPDGEATHKNLNFQLSEARRYTFNYGVGLEVQTGQPSGTSNPQGETGVSPRVSFDVTRLNFRGRNHTLTLKTRYGNLEKLALIGWDAPYLFDSENLLLNFTAFYEQTNDVKTFTARRLEGSAQIKQNLDRATTLVYRMVYRRVATQDLVIDPNLVPLFSQPVRVGMPVFSYIRNTRDNDFDSRKGTFNSFDAGVASNIFGSETNFSRLAIQNSTYHSFHKRRWVFARSTRIGVEEPFGDTQSAPVAQPSQSTTQSAFVPLPERFFAGGPTTHRGFGINQAGPRDLTTGFPVGGEAMFLNNLELRTPPLPFPWVGNNLSAVVFHDIGNVFSTAGDMARGLVRFSQPNRDACLNPFVPTAQQTCSFSYMSQAVGAGIRYRTPVGPVSFDLGYNLNPPAFPVSAPSAPAVPNSQVLRHFNFFFNIGQTF
jgi:outer membrane protein insertion porin family